MTARRPLKELTPTSKGHVRCSLCLALIPAGTRYTQITVLNGGVFHDRRECPACHFAAATAREETSEWLTAAEIDAWAQEQVADMTDHSLLAMNYLQRAGLPGLTHNRNGATE